jgi:hypothetical protein
MGAFIHQQPAKHLKTVGVDIEFVEMIKTGITANFELLNLV